MTGVLRSAKPLAVALALVVALVAACSRVVELTPDLDAADEPIDAFELFPDAAEVDAADQIDASVDAELADAAID